MTIQRFALAGLVSGIFSAVTTTIPGLFFFVPPIAIGVALAVARQSSVAVSALFVVASALAWLAMCVIGAASHYALDNVSPVGFWPVLSISISGAVLFVLAYCMVFRSYASETTFIFVTPIAVALAMFGFGVTYVAHLMWAEPAASLFGFGTLLIVWQTGVAVALGWSERTSRLLPEDNEDHKQSFSPNHGLLQNGHEAGGRPSIERIEP